MKTELIKDELLKFQNKMLQLTAEFFSCMETEVLDRDMQLEIQKATSERLERENCMLRLMSRKQEEAK